MQSLNPTPNNKKSRQFFMLFGAGISMVILLTASQMGFSTDYFQLQKAMPLVIQEIEEPSQDDYVEFADENAKPKEGFEQFSRYLQENINYPKEKTNGKVLIQFIVEKDGRITNAKIKEGLSTEWDSQAIEVLTNAPKWIPAKIDEKPVRQLLTLPVNFKP